MSRQTPWAGLSRRPAVIQHGSPIARGSGIPGTAKQHPRLQRAPRAPQRGVSKGEAVTPTVDKGDDPSRSMPDGSAKTVEAARDRQSAGRRSPTLRGPWTKVDVATPQRAKSATPRRTSGTTMIGTPSHLLPLRGPQRCQLRQRRPIRPSRPPRPPASGFWLSTPVLDISWGVEGDWGSNEYRAQGPFVGRTSPVTQTSPTSPKGGKAMIRGSV